MKLRDPDGFNYTDITVSAGKSRLHQARQAYKLSLPNQGMLRRNRFSILLGLKEYIVVIPLYL